MPGCLQDLIAKTIGSIVTGMRGFRISKVDEHENSGLIGSLDRGKAQGNT